MTRRALLSMLALAALDPERLIWRPGARLISIPKPSPLPQWYLDMIVERALQDLRRQLRFKSGGVVRHYVINDTIHLRRPARLETAA